VVAIGHPVLRQRWQQVLEASGAPLGVVVHPCACVSPPAQLAPGCVMLAGAVVNADVQLEQAVLANSGAGVDHDGLLCGSYSQLGVNAAFGGGSRLRPLASLAVGEVFGSGESPRCVSGMVTWRCGSERGRQLRWHHITISCPAQLVRAVLVRFLAEGDLGHHGLVRGSFTMNCGLSSAS